MMVQRRRTIVQATFEAHRANIEAPGLYERAIAGGEGRLSIDGALVVDTGQHTGRSAKDKFFVREPETETSVWWENNGSVTREDFDRLHADMSRHAETLELHRQDLYACADPAHRIKVRVLTELAWHALFIRNLLIEPPIADLASFAPDLTIVDLPSFKADPTRYGIRSETVIAIDLENRLVLIGGTSYAGEMKKAVFTYLNYVLPPAGIMPMHCAANVGPDGRSALFFGLSGTGKTTLSAVPERSLVGDDEHGWSPSGIFNFEGGCYAKTIRLSRASEPEIYAAARRFGSVLENVAIDPDTRVAGFLQRTPNREHPRRLPASVHRERSCVGCGRSSVQCCAADG